MTDSAPSALVRTGHPAHAVVDPPPVMGHPSTGLSDEVLDRRGEQTELVAFRVSEYYPCCLGRLTDVDGRSAQAQKTLQFLTRADSIRTKIQM